MGRTDRPNEYGHFGSAVLYGLCHCKVIIVKILIPFIVLYVCIYIFASSFLSCLLGNWPSGC
jgi:hypothetical protein